MATWWASQPLTADNCREKPYADIYPRVTTKSNSYTVYMRVQCLKKVAAPDAGDQDHLTWNEDKDRVLSEYRGNSSVERYIDPGDPRMTGAHPEKLPGGVDPDQHSLDPLYKFRIVESKRFTP